MISNEPPKSSLRRDHDPHTVIDRHIALRASTTSVSPPCKRQTAPLEFAVLCEWQAVLLYPSPAYGKRRRLGLPHGVRQRGIGHSGYIQVQRPASSSVLAPTLTLTRVFRVLASAISNAPRERSKESCQAFRPEIELQCLTEHS